MDNTEFKTKSAFDISNCISSDPNPRIESIPTRRYFHDLRNLMRETRNKAFLVPFNIALPSDYLSKWKAIKEKTPSVISNIPYENTDVIKKELAIINHHLNDIRLKLGQVNEGSIYKHIGGVEFEEQPLTEDVKLFDTIKILSYAEEVMGLWGGCLKDGIYKFAPSDKLLRLLKTPDDSEVVARIGRYLKGREATKYPAILYKVMSRIKYIDCSLTNFVKAINAHFNLDYKYKSVQKNYDSPTTPIEAEDISNAETFIKLE